MTRNPHSAQAVTIGFDYRSNVTLSKAAQRVVVRRQRGERNRKAASHGNAQLLTTGNNTTGCLLQPVARPNYCYCSVLI